METGTGGGGPVGGWGREMFNGAGASWSESSSPSCAPCCWSKGGGGGSESTVPAGGELPVAFCSGEG